MANGKGKIGGWTVVVVLLILYAILPGFQGSVNGFLAGLGLGVAPTVDDGITIPCPIEDVTVTLTSANMFSKGSDITNGSHRVFVNGIDKGYIAEDGTLTASPDDEIKVIFGENSSSAYSVIEDAVAPCSGTYDMDAALATYDNSPTFTVYDEYNNVNTKDANVQAMSQDEIYENDLRLKITTKQAYGNPDHPGKGNILCFQYNQTFDSVKLEGAETSFTPKALTSAANTVSSCFYIPVLANSPTDTSDGEWNGVIVTDTGSNDPSAAGYNITIALYDSCIDLHADTLDIIYNVEDEDKNALCALAGSDMLHTS